MLIPTPREILFITEPVDFRRSIDGLAAWVEQRMQRSPLTGQMFVFINRRRNGLKALVWDHGGFVLVFKRLERGRFRVPSVERLSPAELAAVLEGFDLTGRRRLPRWNPDKIPGAPPVMR